MKPIIENNAVVPVFDTLEAMIEWYEKQPAGHFEMLYSSSSAEITTLAPEYKTLSRVEDERCGSVVWHRIKSMVQA